LDILVHKKRLKHRGHRENRKNRAERAEDAEDAEKKSVNDKKTIPNTNIDGVTWTLIFFDVVKKIHRLRVKQLTPAPDKFIPRIHIMVQSEKEKIRKKRKN